MTSQALCAVILVAASAGCAQDLDSSDLTFRSGAELVVLDVGVQDKRGVNVSGLGPENFRVYEDGKLQVLQQFSSEERPATIGLVIDASGSMRSKRTEVITAALSMIGASNPKDEVFVVNFNDTATLGLPPNVPFTDDVTILRKALSFARAQGKTALNDAVLLAIHQLEKGKWDKKALLIVSDGGDNSSEHGFKDVMAAVQDAGVTIYTIGLFDPDDPDKNPGVLQRLTQTSGGESFLPQRIDELGPLCQRIAKDVRSRYTLAYTPLRKNDQMSLRQISVVAKRGSAGRLVVHTRTKYRLPAREGSLPAGVRRTAWLP